MKSYPQALELYEQATGQILQRSDDTSEFGIEFLGVNNVSDRNPPTVLAGPNDNYDTSLYTIRNRYYYIGLNKKF